MGDHTEAVAVDFDPERISYRQLLDLFWESHDPRRSFGGRQYRHAIWYHSEEQRAEIEEARGGVARLFGIGEATLATAVKAAGPFTYAEGYHQKYLLRSQRGVIDQLEGLFADPIAFTDSTVTTRLNGWFGEGFNGPREALLAQLAEFGLPDELERRIAKSL